MTKAPGSKFQALMLSSVTVTIVVFMWNIFSGVAVAQSSENKEKKMTKVLIAVGSEQVIATFDDNATARAFLALLPMTLTLEDYNNTEKISELPKRLSTEDAPEGIDPDVGDITYYAPWGNLAIFYRDFGYANGLVRLGRIESGIEHLTQAGTLTVTIDRVE